MMRTILLAGALSTACATAVAQEQIPDLKGTWTGKSTTIVQGRTAYHSEAEDWNRPRLREIDFTITIDDQTDRRFSGTVAAGDVSQPLVGVLSRSDDVFHFAIPAGTGMGYLASEDAFEICYHESGADGVVAACTEYQRQK